MEYDLIANITSIPGQTSISHFCVIVRFPSQSLPPFKAGCNILRFKVLIPSPHVAEHSVIDQSIGDNLQSTKSIKVSNLIEAEICMQLKICHQIIPPLGL